MPRLLVGKGDIWFLRHPNGIGVPTRVLVPSSSLTLSLSDTYTYQINPNLVDVHGDQNLVTSVITQGVESVSNGNMNLLGVFVNGVNNAYQGLVFRCADFYFPASDGTFICTASSINNISLANTNAQVHLQTITIWTIGSQQVAFRSNSPCATVSSTGLITGVSAGQATIEVSYPTFSNSLGYSSDCTNPVINGIPAEKIYKEITVQVQP